ncbi:MAG: hypothetical protein A2Z71_01100 [Chloroflexi bacterium RBG_13_50_21]|nr:MAG: hypothetical protein A2Z71_01100 [Chloroflexi bacterium RBG_13_50_21]
MRIVSQTIKFRQQRQAKELRKPWKKLGLISALLISLLLAGVTLVGLFFFVDLTQNLPPVGTLASLLEPPNGTLLQPTRLYDRTHEHIILTLENPAAANRRYLQVGKNSQESSNQVSQYLVDATITAFDPYFWHHPGFILTGMTDWSHSTLAQQLISTLVLDAEQPSLKRNLREMMLATQVTAKFGREKIMEWYLNSAQYGEDIYGADAAAWVYFGKSATRLSLAEAAMLTAIAETPPINPLSGSPNLKEQQELIIQRMLVDGLVNGVEARQALEEDIKFQDSVETWQLAPAFSSLVLKQLSSVLPVERIRRGGYEIITSLDYGLQLQADCASQIQRARIMGIEQPADTYDGSDCEADDLLPTLHGADEKPPEDLNAEVVISDPQSGQILAMVGEDVDGMFPPYPASHPSGSILSPFLYLTAFSRGMSPATLLWDLPINEGSGTSAPIPSSLAQGIPGSYHGPVSLRMAFVNDYKGAAAEALRQVGIENIWLTEKQFGITTPQARSSSGVDLEHIYTQEISLLDSVQAYSVLANQGIMAGQADIGDTGSNAQNGLSSTSILRVVGVDERVWLDWTQPQSLPVVSPQIAHLTTDVLSDENARWPTLGHPNGLEIGRPAAAKVSLTAEANNAWAVGYIPQLSIGVWMGDSQGELGRITAEMPAGLWHAMMQYASNQMPVEEFKIPTGISQVQVCDPSGLLVSKICPAVTQGVFLEGNEPRQIDNLYQKFYINRESGLLATIFTPADMVDEKVYLVIPEQAEAWAKDTGLPIPPDAYDYSYTPPTASQDVQFTVPRMFDHVSGQISFTGSAGGKDFSYFRLQVGQGLYPQKWIQIGEDVDSPVNHGYLGTWDTTGLDGSYIVQLMVVRQDKKFDLANLQLTIDNTPPELNIISPKDDDQFTYKEGKIIIMNAAVNDNQVLERVEFFVDDMLVSTLLEPPYIIPWHAQPGEYTVKITAYDLAGNQDTKQLSFSVIK